MNERLLLGWSVCGYFKLASFFLLVAATTRMTNGTPLGKPIALWMGNTTEGKCETLVMRSGYDCDDGL